MRIIWNIEENWFQAEYQRDEVELLKAAKFKTTGPPSWAWYTFKASSLDKLRDSKPASGLTITEVALANYKVLSEQETKKKELKKLFEKGKVAAQRDQAGSKTREYEKDGFTSFIVEQKDSGFVPTYARPESPKDQCLVCEDPLYLFDSKNICMWCEQEFK